MGFDFISSFIDCKLKPVLFVYWISSADYESDEADCADEIDTKSLPVYWPLVYHCTNCCFRIVDLRLNPGSWSTPVDAGSLKFCHNFNFLESSYYYDESIWDWRLFWLAVELPLLFFTWSMVYYFFKVDLYSGKLESISLTCLFPLPFPLLLLFPALPCLAFLPLLAALVGDKSWLLSL